AQGQLNSAEQVTIQDQVAKNEAATMGFWANKNGQKLLSSYTATGAASLGSWLASNYNKLFGNLANATGAQVATYFETVVKASASGVIYNTYAQALTTALAVYVTGPGYNATAASYGFKKAFGGLGLGDVYYNVGSNGASFGVAKNSYVKV